MPIIRYKLQPDPSYRLRTPLRNLYITEREKDLVRVVEDLLHKIVANEPCLLCNLEGLVSKLEIMEVYGATRRAVDLDEVVTAALYERLLSAGILIISVDSYYIMSSGFDLKRIMPGPNAEEAPSSPLAIIETIEAAYHPWVEKRCRNYQFLLNTATMILMRATKCCPIPGWYHIKTNIQFDNIMTWYMRMKKLHCEKYFEFVEIDKSLYPLYDEYHDMVDTDVVTVDNYFDLTVAFFKA